MLPSGPKSAEIMFIGEAPGCIGGESLIATAFRDKSKFPDGIPIKDLVGKKGFYVYSFDRRNNKLVLGLVTKVWKTGIKKAYKVTYKWSYAEGMQKVYLEDSLIVTSNHPFLLKEPSFKDPFKGINKKGGYLSIDQGLQKGHSIQPFHSNLVTGRYHVGISHDEMYREARFLLEFKEGRKLKKGEECHHDDENKLNDTWGNILLETTESHARLHTLRSNPMHSAKARRAHKRAMQSPIYRKGQSEKLKTHLSDPEAYEERIKQILATNPARSETVKNKYKDPGYWLRSFRGRQEWLGWSDERLKVEFEKKFPEHAFPENHVITKIEFIGMQAVYDMEVEKYHNFAVNGIFVHNSKEDEQDKQFVGASGDLLWSRVPRNMRDKIRVNNAINCRPPGNRKPEHIEIECIIEGSLVEPVGGIRKLYRRWYNGPLITFETMRGNFLSVTPNHPVFTEKGTTPAKGIKVGDHLIRSSGRNRIGGGVPNINHEPTLIDDIFSSFSKVFKIDRTRSSSFDFHGDGKEGYIDVIRTDSFLRTGPNTFSAQEAGKNFFPSPSLTPIFFRSDCSLDVRTDVVSVPTSDFSFNDGVSVVPSDHTFRSISGSDVIAYEKGFNSSSHNLFGSADFFQAFPREISCNYISRRLPKHSSREISLFIESADFYSIFDEPSFDEGRISSDNFFEIAKSFSLIDVEIDEIVSIKETNFSGHVYNLETDSGSYIANGLAVHNCCRSRIVSDVELVRPRVIVGLGLTPFQWLTGFNTAKMYIVRGRLFAARIGSHDCWFYAAAHPAGLLRQRQQDRRGREQKSNDELAWERDIDHIFAVWDRLPDPRPHDPKDASKGVITASGKKGDADFNLVMDFLDRAARSKLSGLDLETKKLRPYWPDSKILTVAISLGLEDTLAFAWDHPQAGWSQSQKASIQQAYIKYLTSRSRKAAHNYAFEAEWHAHQFGWDILRAGLWEDTMSQASALDERFTKKMNPGPLSLEFLVHQHFGFNLKILFDSLDKNNLDKEPVGKVLEYNGPDAKYHRALCEVQEDLLDEQGLLDGYDTKLRRIPTCVLTQLKGVPVARSVTADLSEKYSARITEIENKLFSLSAIKEVERIKPKREPYKPGSADDVTILLKDVLGTKIGRKEDGSYSTEAEVLEEVGHPACDLTVEWRHATKVKSTYIDPYEPPSVENSRGRLYPDGNLHCIFNTVFTSTDRLSSEDPNLQNQIKRDKEAKEIRKQVRPAKKGEVVAPFDYGQIEFRVLGMASRDKTVVQMLWERYDVHKDWALRIAKRYPNWIKEPMHQFLSGSKKGADLIDAAIFGHYRNKVKNEWVFPLCFGASLARVAAELGIDEDVLKPEREEFWRIFHGVADWHDDMTKFYDKHGYVETLTGHHRRRYPLTFNEYINEPIQGTTAEIVMNAMSTISELAEKRDDWYLQPVLNIHDDLTFILPENRVDEYAEVIIDRMLDVNLPFVNVPITVEMSMGKDWYSAKEVGTYASDQWLDWPKRMAA
jgi:DNA polymerase I-like protein with 3'-5' exonuclease and polymerase domains/intein/homing endonuclease